MVSGGRRCYITSVQIHATFRGPRVRLVVVSPLEEMGPESRGRGGVGGLPVVGSGGHVERREGPACYCNGIPSGQLLDADSALVGTLRFLLAQSVAMATSAQ